MRHISPYIDQNTMIKTINESLAGHEHAIAQAISFESIAEECRRLDELEASIPLDIRFQIELNNIINKTNESILDVFNYLKEQAEYGAEVISELPTDATKVGNEIGDEWDNVMANIKSTADKSGIKSEGESKSLMETLKDLSLALTEDGSPIGILHLVLDIIGLFGDAFLVVGIPVGVAADFINAVIYIVRASIIKDKPEKRNHFYLLAVISLVAAFIPFGGDAIKTLFKGTKAGVEGAQIFTKYMTKTAAKEGSAMVTKEAAQLIAKADPATKKSMEYLAKSSDKAMPLASKFMHKFFNQFLGTIVGWIPVLGKPLKKFFARIANLFGDFSKGVGRFADDFPKALKEADVHAMDNFFRVASSKNAKITAKGDDLIIKGYRGEARISADLLSSSQAITKRYGEKMTKNIEKLVPLTEKNSRLFFTQMADLLEQSNKAYGKTNTFAKVSGGLSAAGEVASRKIKMSNSITAFLGKEIVKLMGLGDKNGITNLSDSEIEAFGSAAAHNAMQDRIKRDLEKNPNAIYTVPYVDELEDSKTLEALKKTQNDYAEMFNLPKIDQVVYAKHKDDLPEEVEAWFNATYEDKKDEMEKMTIDIDRRMVESMKHVIPFKNFIK